MSWKSRRREGRWEGRSKSDIGTYHLRGEQSLAGMDTIEEDARARLQVYLRTPPI
jgi:hypothetical protein